MGPRSNRRLASVVVLFVLVLSGLALGTGDAASATLKKYAATGDSIARGSAGWPPDDWLGDAHGYPDELIGFLGAGHTLEKVAVNGDDTSDLLGHLTTPGSAVQNAVLGATNVTICIGGNNLLHCADWPFDVIDDSVRACMDEGVAQFAADWPAIVDAVKALNPGARLVVMTIYNPFRGSDWQYNEVRPRLDSINSTIKSYTWKGYSVADVATKFKGTFPLFSGDWFLYYWKVCKYTNMCWLSDPHLSPAGDDYIGKIHEPYMLK